MPLGKKLKVARVKKYFNNFITKKKDRIKSINIYIYF